MTFALPARDAGWTEAAIFEPSDSAAVRYADILRLRHKIENIDELIERIGLITNTLVDNPATSDISI